MTTTLAAATKIVGEELKTAGFRRSGSKFVRQGDQVVSLIELQRSRRKGEPTQFVINYGVVVPCLFQGESLTKPEYTDCHWGGRVGDSEGREVWWVVSDDEPPSILASKVVNAVKARVFPVLEALQTESSLIELWRSGRSPLLVEGQRLQFLGTLLHRAGRRDEYAETKAELAAKASDPFSVRALQKLALLEE